MCWLPLRLEINTVIVGIGILIPLNVLLLLGAFKFVKHQSNVLIITDFICFGFKSVKLVVDFIVCVFVVL
jgi:hypothetical protein